FVNLEQKDNEKTIHMAKIDDEIKKIKNSSVCEAGYSVSNTTLTEMKNFVDTPAFDINSEASVKTHNAPISSQSVNTLGINAPNNASNFDITEKVEKVHIYQEKDS
ncbi:2306_t:CDS:1, partial [Dentiscutata heterogama]